MDLDQPRRAHLSQPIRHLIPPNQQELSNLLNGFANLGHQPGDDVLSRVVLEAEAKLTDFNPQVLTGCVVGWDDERSIPVPDDDDLTIPPTHRQELAIFANALGRLASATGSNGYRPPRIFMEKVRLLFEAKVRACGNVHQIGSSTRRPVARSVPPYPPPHDNDNDSWSTSPRRTWPTCWAPSPSWATPRPPPSGTRPSPPCRPRCPTLSRRCAGAFVCVTCA